MKKNIQIINQLKLEFPEIFTEYGDISLLLLSSSITLHSNTKEADDDIFVRIVIFEKVGNIYGKKNRLLKLISKLSSSNGHSIKIKF